MTWLAIALIALFLFDGLRLRHKAAALREFPEPAAPAAVAAGRMVCHRDVTLAPGTAGDVAAWAHAEGLDVVDVVPKDLPAIRALALLQLVEVGRYRSNRLAVGRSAGHALWMSRDVELRSGVEPSEAPDVAALVKDAVVLKRFACTSTDVVVAGKERGSVIGAAEHGAAVRANFTSMTPFLLGGQAVLLLGIAATLIVPGARPWGLGALAAFHLQPVLALWRTPLAPRDLWRVALLRWLLDARIWLATLLVRDDEHARLAAAARPTYDRLLAGGVDRFLEPRRTTCPLCDGTRLLRHVHLPDVVHRKPGRFTLERCRDCGHIFQNPRLSLEGLDFYYRDFYDGLGAEGVENIFALSHTEYLARAHSVRGHIEPSRWLDVGGGHGHLCCVARDVWPDTKFDCLDLSSSVEEAKRRGWIDEAYRGLFPDLAPRLAGRYGVVSMSHYLEHTRDPVAEVAAARTALCDGGCLMIEVPNPYSPLGRLLGRYWLPWFQPQHQHLVSPKNLERILREHDFEPVAWELKRAHIPVDLLAAVVLFFNHIAPPNGEPWRPPPTPAGRFAHTTLWTIGLALLLPALITDRLLAPIVVGLGFGNAYRVVAKKRSGGAGMTKSG